MRPGARSFFVFHSATGPEMSRGMTAYRRTAAVIPTVVLTVIAAATTVGSEPLRAVRPKSVHLDPTQAVLGRQLFFDTSLSNPVGQACASCHAVETGFRFPDSTTNQVFGVASGAIS